jgi:putative oxidoreductase
MLSILRIVAALLFLQSGTQKFFGFPPGGNQPAMFALLWFQGILELLAVFLILGLFTRPVAFLLSGDMAVAYFMAHSPRGFFPLLNQGNASILFCFIFLYIFFAGPGPWSVDAMWRRTPDDPAYRRHA